MKQKSTQLFLDLLKEIAEGLVRTSVEGKAPVDQTEGCPPERRELQYRVEVDGSSEGDSLVTVKNV